MSSKTWPMPALPTSQATNTRSTVATIAIVTDNTTRQKTKWNPWGYSIIAPLLLLFDNTSLWLGYNFNREKLQWNLWIVYITIETVSFHNYTSYLQLMIFIHYVGLHIVKWSVFEMHPQKRKIENPDYFISNFCNKKKGQSIK